MFSKLDFAKFDIKMIQVRLKIIFNFFEIARAERGLPRAVKCYRVYRVTR